MVVLVLGAKSSWGRRRSAPNVDGRTGSLCCHSLVDVSALRFHESWFLQQDAQILSEENLGKGLSLLSSKCLVRYKWSGRGEQGWSTHNPRLRWHNTGRWLSSLCTCKQVVHLAQCLEFDWCAYSLVTPAFTPLHFTSWLRFYILFLGYHKKLIKQLASELKQNFKITDESILKLMGAGMPLYLKISKYVKN